MHLPVMSPETGMLSESAVRCLAPISSWNILDVPESMCRISYLLIHSIVAIKQPEIQDDDHDHKNGTQGSVNMISV